MRRLFAVIPLGILIAAVLFWPNFSQGQAASHGSFLTWTPSTSATSYNIYRGTATGAETTLAGSVQASAICVGSPVKCTYVDPLANLTAGTTYFYVVKAVNAVSQESGASNEASAAIPNAPGVVLDLVDVVK